MGITSDNGFIALGPIPIGFSTFGTNILAGILSIGNTWGIVGWGGDPGPVPGPSFRNGAGTWSTSARGPGIVGTSGRDFGVFGQAGEAGEPAGTAGVCGTSQAKIGVIGSSSTNVAVFGQANKFIGVYGTSNESIGVRGESAGSGPAFGGGGDVITPAGVVGTSVPAPGVIGTSEKSFGLAGQSGKSGMLVAESAAVFGTSADAIAISGISNRNVAVRGIALGSDAVLGVSATGSGVKGFSFAPPRAAGVPLADAPAGVYGQSTGGTIGVLGVVNPTASSGAGVAGVGGPKVPAGYFEGNIIVTGQVFAGIKDAIVPFPDGSQRVLHCMESPEHWFEDFGTAKLKRGRTVVKLDADFAKVIKRGDYHVFLTPKGDCRGLCVRRQGGASFEVRELQGGTSSIAFSYRIVGKRKDINRHTRFAKIETPSIPIRGHGLPSSMRALFTALEKEARKRGT